MQEKQADDQQVVVETEQQQQQQVWQLTAQFVLDENANKSSSSLQEKQEQDLEEQDTLLHEDQQAEDNSLKSKLYRLWRQKSLDQILYLVLVGICTSFLAVIVNSIMLKLLEARIHIATVTDSYLLNYVIYIAVVLCFSMFGAFCVHFISPYAAGSGIPEMKIVTSGNLMGNFLEFPTLIAKVLGLIAIVGGAGWYVGIEGPFIHIGGCIAYLMLKLPFFKQLIKRKRVRSELLTSACGSGLAAAFGAPFGGLFFSIEVTSIFYIVDCFWKGFLCCSFGAIAFFVFRQLGLIGKMDGDNLSLFSTNFEPMAIHPGYYTLFIVLGVICGLLGALFVYCFQQLRLRVNDMVAKYGSCIRYVPILAVGFITAAISFPLGSYYIESQESVIHNLFNGVSSSHSIPGLFLFFVLRFCLTLVSSVLPVPSGLLVPSIMIGSAVGRFFGEVVKLVWTDSIPGVFSVMGAAAFTMGTSRKLSTIILIFELTGQFVLLLPVIITCLIALAIGNLFNGSVYDVISQLNYLTYLKPVKQSANKKKPVRDLMSTEFAYITVGCSLRSLAKARQQATLPVIPIVKSDEDMTLLGIVHKTHVDQVLGEATRRIKQLSTKSTDTVEEFAPSSIVVYPTDYQVPSCMRTKRLVWMFLVHQQQEYIFCVERGKLVGVVTREQLIGADL